MTSREPGDKLSRRYFTSLFGLGVLGAAAGVRLAENVTAEGAELARRMLKYAGTRVRTEYYGYVTIAEMDPERPVYRSWRVEGS